MSSVLMVLTGSTVWTMKDGTPHPTGFSAEEFTRPHKTFSDAGLKVSIATPQGRTPVVDPLSLALPFNGNDAAAVESHKAYIAAKKSTLEGSNVLGRINPSDFDVMFICGGHGPMQDLAVDPDIGGLIAAILGDENKILASICHGTASFLTAHDGNGQWLFRGRKLTAFSNQEETMASFAGNAPWLLEDRLRLAGANYVAKPAWTPHVVTDGNLVTGQQSTSAQVTADAVMNLLKVAV
jgi:putative intracellular protease/amidase